MDERDENFQTAQSFISRNLEYHSFSDTSEHAVDRQLQAVKRKLILHGQDERAARLQYLLEELSKRKGSFK